MLLHFIFVIKEEDIQKRKSEFEYIKKMAQFYKKWINDNFGINYEIQCDELITKPRSIFQKLDTHTLVRDHEQRGKDTYHFYLTHFKPLWTDCTCEGYHAENFGMIFWQKPNVSDDILFLAEKDQSIPNPNPLTKVSLVPYQKALVDVQANGAIYQEIVTQLELQEKLLLTVSESTLSKR